MLSCAPPKPCDPRTHMNRTNLIRSDYYAQALKSSFNRIVIDTNGSSTVDLHDNLGPTVLASKGKLAENTEESVGECNFFFISRNKKVWQKYNKTDYNIH